MRLAIDRLARPIALSLLVAACTTVPLLARQTDAAAAQREPDAAAITRALNEVKADPNFATTHTIKTLKWKTAAAPRTSTGVPVWLRWLVDLFQWFGQATRWIVWCTLILLAGFLGAYIYRVVRTHTATGDATGFIAPTHVQDLDIRPESLPADIGRAARALWDAGEHRAALALLYRGLLSRLAHTYQVPIRDSSTEGDCLSLASSHLDHTRHDYASRLVRVWQRNVYGNETVETPIVHALCEGFAPTLDNAVGSRA